MYNALGRDLAAWLSAQIDSLGYRFPLGKARVIYQTDF